MTLRRETDSDPQFKALKNSDLVCKNCVLKDEDDFSVFSCVSYPYGKPASILYGAPCENHMTIERALELYGDERE